jgi:hypothetical protein
MCDYSLYTIPNRLADEGEELVLHRFATGTLGFASVSDLAQQEIQMKDRPAGFWPAVKAFFAPRRCAQLPAVCIPPGTHLYLDDVPKAVQNSLCVRCPELVLFTELSNRSYSYRDALLLPNGTRVLLQDLPEGIHATVLSTVPETTGNPVPAEVYVG